MKNREIDELKVEISNLRKDYELEIQTMFMELQRVKEDLGSRFGSSGQQPNNKVNNYNVPSA